MSEKRWTVSLIILFALFLYVFHHFAAATMRIEETVNRFDKRDEERPDRLHFVIIGQEYDNPYWRKVEKGASDAAHHLQVEVEYVGPLRTSVEEQLKLLEKAIASKVDGIIVQGLLDEAFTPVINKAIHRNIPVITIDTDAPSSKRLAYVGTNNYAAGRLLGEAIIERTRGNQKIGIIIGTETSENQKLRLKGLESVLERHPRFEIVAVRHSNISKIQASIQAEKILRTYPDISIMVGTSALDATGILIATKNLNRDDVQIFGFDDVEETIKAVGEGKIQAAVVQKPYSMGYDAVQLMYEYLKGRAIGELHFTPTELID